MLTKIIVYSAQNVNDGELEFINYILLHIKETPAKN